ncbi:MAG: hypothetical protein ACLUPK_08325 [Veillonella sp.]
MNFPLRGTCDWDHFKMVSQGLQTYSNIIEARINSRGQDYYWLAGELDYGAESVPTDVEFARKGYINRCRSYVESNNVISDMESGSKYFR